MDNYNYILLVCGRLQLYFFCLYVDNYSYTAFACMWIITVILLLLMWIINYRYTAFACMWIITGILLLLVCG